VMSVASKNFRPFNAHFVQGNTYKSDGARWGECGGYSSVATLFFPSKSLTKTNRCAGALSWRRNKQFVSIFRGVAFWQHPQGDKWCHIHILTFRDELIVDNAL
jgi:hypothetical protein